MDRSRLYRGAQHVPTPHHVLRGGCLPRLAWRVFAPYITGHFFGCPVSLSEETTWLQPILTDPDLDVEGLQFDRQERWWKFTMALLERAAAECSDKAIPSVVRGSGCGDMLATLRGAEAFLVDVATCPDRVYQAELYLVKKWIEAYNAYYDIISRPGVGMTCWMPLWAPGRHFPVQCGISYMISPKAFRKIFLPIVEQQTAALEYVVYHVDGVNAFEHVPALLELPGIQALQILPGAGKPSPLHYLNVLKAVQAAGRGLHITLRPEQVEDALEVLSARGLCIQTRCESEEQAVYLVRNAEKWSRDRRSYDA